MAKGLSIQDLIPTTVDNDLAVNNIYVGIDFGTSTTAASIATFDYKNKKFRVENIPIEQLSEVGARLKSKLLPTVIALCDDGRLLIGEGASSLKYELHKGRNVWFSFKMELGENKEYYESELIDSDSSRIRTPQDAATVFFGYLRQQIIKYCEKKGLGTNIEYAISVPASFEANQRKDLLEALRRNGMVINNQCLIDEPNAAFLSYINESIHSTRSEDKIIIQNTYNPKVLVFDCGAGTCDISILEIGRGPRGFYSKNISISKFTALGGDDIDRYIARNYLLPQLLSANRKQGEKLRLPDIRFITDKLLKTAEQLKTNICQTISIMTSNYELPNLCNSDEKVSVNVPIEIDTKIGVLQKNSFSLSYKEFTDIMNKVFLNHNEPIVSYDGEKKYNSIFNPIDSAIRKSRINKDEIDYVLFIGGSSKNPYIQSALSNYFNESELLVPPDMQTHVSKGVAIHSLIVNKTGRNIIEPITSEPIIVITRNDVKKILIPAGQVVPCEKIVIDDLFIAREGQKEIEMPICVSNKDKMLFNLKIKSLSSNGFSINDRVVVEVAINADKLLQISVTCDGRVTKSEQINPFANIELSNSERLVVMAERDFERSKNDNGGTPTEESFDNLINAYIKAGKYFYAADTEEMKAEYYENANWNNIGLKYSDAGNDDKAMMCYEKALSENPNNPTVNFNYAMAAKHHDRQKYKKYITKAFQYSPNDPVHIMEYGRMLNSTGCQEESLRLFEKAKNIFEKRLKDKRMKSWDWSWFKSLANELEDYELEDEIEKAEKEFKNAKKEVDYDKDNLLNSHNVELIKHL